LLMAMDDYVRASGDVDYLKQHWQALQKAYEFERAHTTDGMYDNTQGTGWVESWPPRMPRQELYLTALDEQSCEAVARLATLMGDSALAEQAQQTAQIIRPKLAQYRGTDGFYAFSRNPDGSYDYTPTMFPAVAWWSGDLALPDAGAMFTRWASHEISTDWGTRSVSERSPIFDPISYHQGTVWPVFTGWVSMAEFRAGRPLSGYEHLMQNADLTFASDLGAVTELLSGRFYDTLGRSSSHQLWSSAMVTTPGVRGVFGIESDVLHKTLHLHPHLPPEWDHATLRNVPFGKDRLSVNYIRRDGGLEVTAQSESPVALCFTVDNKPCNAGAPERTHTVRIPLEDVEVGIPHGLPEPGSETHQLKVLNEAHTAGKLTLSLEAMAQSQWELPLRLNRKVKLTSNGATVKSEKLQVTFPPGEGYVQQTVELTWTK
jgi:hypothetical protein